jgi:prepilin-type N-terminal cleavage/methylation domain-containing protein
MNYQDKRAFTLIEVAIVMVVLGLILGLGIPMMKMLMKQNKLTENRTAVHEAKEALIGYAFANGKLPKYNTGYLLPYNEIGTRQADAYGNVLTYDVNLQLTSTTNVSDFCQKVQQLLQQDATVAGSAGRPKIDSHSVAFVVISKGNDYKLDNANNTTSGNYENPKHPYNEQTANDIVDSVSFGYLNSLCLKNAYFDNSSTSGGTSGYTSTYAALASQAAEIAEKFPNKPPKESELNLPSGYSYKRKENIGILTYNGKQARIYYEKNGKRVIAIAVK